VSNNQATPKSTREAIGNALAELRSRKPSNPDLETEAIDIILRHLRDRHAHDATTAELLGETPLQLFQRMYPKPDTDDGGGILY
jgi:hypothetical protein